MSITSSQRCCYCSWCSWFLGEEPVALTGSISFLLFFIHKTYQHDVLLPSYFQFGSHILTVCIFVFSFLLFILPVLHILLAIYPVIILIFFSSDFVSSISYLSNYCSFSIIISPLNSLSAPTSMHIVLWLKYFWGHAS